MQRGLGSKPAQDALVHLPITRANLRTQLPLVLRQFFSFSVRELQAHKALVRRLYAPEAVFDYPLARCEGVDAILAFWSAFLIARGLQRLDVHSLEVDVVWDEPRLTAYVELQAWQHSAPLAWLDRLVGAAGWKVCTTQVLCFEPHEADGPGALRIKRQVEQHDQFIFLGLLPAGLWAIRTDEGTYLNAARDAVRWAGSAYVRLSAAVIEPVLTALGWIEA